MNQILKLVLFIACLSQAVRANYSIYPTDELFSSVAKRDLSNGIELNLNGAVYAAEFYEKRDRVPVSLMNDDEGNSINFLMDGSHEFYYDGENNAAITVSTHRHPESAEEKRTVRANIYLPDSNEIILVEPDENDSSFSRVSRRSLNKREFEFFDSRNFSDAGPFEKRQTKRSSGVAKNFVELIMVADYPYYTSLIEQLGTKNDEKISTYVEAYFSQLAFLAEMCYERSLRNEQLKIKIVPIEFIILKTSQSSSFTTSSEAQALFEGKSKNGINQAYTNSDKIIGEGNKVGLLPKWANEKLGNKKFDTLVVVTATDLCTCARNSNRAINPQVMGMAPLAGICTKNRNVFIIEGYKSNYNLESVTLAHELGHNLGLNHDGEEDECSNEEGYIMADGYRADENFLNSFSFSECSIRKLVENVYENGEFECLQNPVQPDQDVQRYGQFFPGQVYNLTEQCLLTIDENALTIPKIVRPGETFRGERLTENLCQTLYCMNEDGGFFSLRAAFEKSSCGDGKWCVAGECVADPKAPTGQCLTETDVKLCKRIENQGYDPCYNLGTTRCCEYCNKGKKTVQRVSGQTMKDWLKSGTVNNARFI